MCRRMGKEGHCQENRNQMNSELTEVTVSNYFGREHYYFLELVNGIEHEFQQNTTNHSFHCFNNNHGSELQTNDTYFA